MATLWTPEGEVPVSRHAREAAGADPSDLEAPDPPINPPIDPLDEAQSLNLEDLSPEEREKAEEAIRQLAETRERIRSVPAAMVVANHAMGLYELAAIHLAAQPPNFGDATVAIDALGALTDGMAGRLGDAESTLREGLSQMRMAYVQLKQKTPATNGTDTEGS